MFPKNKRGMMSVFQGGQEKCFCERMIGENLDVHI